MSTSRLQAISKKKKIFFIQNCAASLNKNKKGINEWKLDQLKLW